MAEDINKNVNVKINYEVVDESLGNVTKQFRKKITDLTTAGTELNKKGNQLNDNFKKEEILAMAASQKVGKLSKNTDAAKKSTKTASKETESYTEHIGSLMSNAGASFRTFLPLMFSFQQASKVMESAIQPALDLLGVNELYQQFLAIKYLPTAMEQLENVLELGDAWDGQSEEERKAEGDLVLLTKRMSELVSYVSQSAMMFGALGEIFPTLDFGVVIAGVEITGREMGSMLGVTIGLSSAISALSTDAGNTITNVDGLGSAIAIGGTDAIAGFGTQIGLLTDGKLTPAKVSVDKLAGAIYGMRDKTVNVTTNAPTTGIEELKRTIDLLKDKVLTVTTNMVTNHTDNYTGGTTASKSIFSTILSLSNSLNWPLNFMNSVIKSVLGFEKGGIVPNTGLAYLHAGETVIPAGSNTISPNITINASVSSDYDVRRLASQLSQYWSNDFERLTKSRGLG